MILLTEEVSVFSERVMPLARKWRPKELGEVVGQFSVVYTLSQAVRWQRLAPAYVLTGSRGVGKTTLARLFSKLVRCEAPVLGNRELLKTCGICQSCLSDRDGSLIDIIEIDGASYNGVDAIRDIRDQARYLPTSGKKKIYIVDEVHMLSQAAFNALLKLLEEPPLHVLFVFATTEVHKIPDTVLSRCQRFDCVRLSPQQIKKRLEEISQHEGLLAESSALSFLARLSEGGMRDALSLLDQVWTYCGDQPITLAKVKESLGMEDESSLDKILDGIFKKELLPALDAIHFLEGQGISLKQLGENVLEAIRGVLLAKIASQSQVFQNFSEERQKKFFDLAEARSLEEIELLFQVVNQGLDWIHQSHVPRLVWDALLVKCAASDFLKYLGPPVPTAVEKEPTRVERSPQVIAESSPVVMPPIAPQVPIEVSPRLQGTQDLSALWEPFLKTIKKSHPLLASFLEQAHAVWMKSEELWVAFKQDKKYFKEQLQTRGYQEPLRALATQFFKKPTLVNFVLEEGMGESYADRKQKEAEQQKYQVEQQAREHPLLRESQALFGGAWGPLRLKEKPAASS